MAVLTDKELVLFISASYRVTAVLHEVMNAIKRQGGDVTLLPEVVRDLAEIVITPTVETKED